MTGLLCWRDFHPLEWQLASLHWPSHAGHKQNETRNVFAVLLTFRVKLGVSGHLQHGLDRFQSVQRFADNDTCKHVRW